MEGPLQLHLNLETSVLSFPNINIMGNRFYLKYFLLKEVHFKGSLLKEKDFNFSLTFLLIITEFTKELSICLWFSFNSSSFGEDTWSRLDCMSSWSRLGLFSATNLHITRTWIDTSKSRQLSQWATVTGHLIWSYKWPAVFNKDPLLFSFGCQKFSIFHGNFTKLKNCYRDLGKIIGTENWKQS